MNIGLSNVNSDYVLFLNSGDYFASDFSLSIFEHDLDTTTSPVSCFSYSALNTYDSSDAFIRYPWSVSLPCHQSFIAPHDPLFPLIFDESKRLSADCDWIKRNISMYGCHQSPFIFSVFSLGGLSSSFSLNSLRTRLSEKSYVAALKLLFKYLISVFIGSTLLRRYLSFYHRYTHLPSSVSFDFKPNSLYPHSPSRIDHLT